MKSILFAFSMRPSAKLATRAPSSSKCSGLIIPIKRQRGRPKRIFARSIRTFSLLSRNLGARFLQGGAFCNIPSMKISICKYLFAFCYLFIASCHHKHSYVLNLNFQTNSKLGSYLVCSNDFQTKLITTIIQSHPMNLNYQTIIWFNPEINHYLRKIQPNAFKIQTVPNI